MVKVVGQVPLTSPAPDALAERLTLERLLTPTADLSYPEFEKAARKVLIDTEIPASVSAYRHQVLNDEESMSGRPLVVKPRLLDYYSLTKNGWNELSSVMVDRLRLSDLEKSMISAA